MFDWLFRKKNQIRGRDLLPIMEELHVKGYRGDKPFGWLPQHVLRGAEWFSRETIDLPNELRTAPSLNWCVVRKYSALTTPFPPLLTDCLGNVVEGVHRLHAASMRGDKKIDVYIPENCKGVKL